MFNINRLFTLMYLMDADPGGAAGTPPAADPAPEPNSTEPDPSPASTEPQEGIDTPPQEPDIPKFASQLNPKKRESEDYKKYLYKHQKLDDIADDYVALNKRMEKAIEIPGKDAKPEDIKAFMQKLGVPEKESDYELNLGKNPSKEISKLADEMRKDYMRAGMTKQQAKVMWGSMLKNIQEGQNQLKAIVDHQQQQAQTFDARLAAKLETSYPVKAERDGAMQETVNLFKQHISRTGLGKVYKDSGLIYNPDFVMAIAKDEKSRSGSGFVEGRPGVQGEKPMGAFGNNYHESFKHTVGGR